MDMKKNLLVSFLFFLFVTGTYAQHFESLSECKSIEDTLRYLQHTFLEPKDKFVGKPAKEVIIDQVHGLIKKDYLI